MKKELKLIALLLVLLLAVSGCGAEKKESDNYYTLQNSNGDTGDMGEYYGYAGSDSNQTVSSKNEEVTFVDPLIQSSRKMIYTAQMTLNTKKFNESEQAILDKLAELKGYVSSHSSSGGYTTASGYYRSKQATIVARVPAESFDAFLNGLYDFGDVTDKSSNAKDVTTEYTDVEARLNALYAERDSLNTMLKSASTVSDIIEIRDRLSNVNYEIESYTVTKRNYDNQISYSTITIYLNDTSEVSFVTKTFGEDFTEAVRNSWVNLINFLQDSTLFIVNIFPFAILFAIVFFAARAILRAYRAKHPVSEDKLKRKAEKQMRKDAKRRGFIPQKEVPSDIIDDGSKEK